LPKIWLRMVDLPTLGFPMIEIYPQYDLFM